MKFLIVGAGATGGYFGGRLVEAGQDVTFLVRDNRKNQLEQHGLMIESIHGNFDSKVKMLTLKDDYQAFDIIIIALKAYQLESVIKYLSNYMHGNTLILPLLNGYQQYDMLFDYFNKEKVLGGLCFIESTLKDGMIVQSSPRHDIIFGHWEGTVDERVKNLYQCFANAKCNVTMSEQIQTDIWQKYIFIASMSGITSLFRSSIGPILENKQSDQIYRALIHEISAIARMKFELLPENIDEMIYNTSTALSYTMKSSMQRDMEKGLHTEGEHLQGYLLKLAGEHNFPILQTVYSNLLVYEQSNI